MSLDMKNLIELGKIAASADASAPVSYSFGEEKFNYAEINAAFRNEMQALVGTPSLWRQNKNTAFTIMEEVIDSVLPKKVYDQFGMFAEISNFNDGDKPVFTQRITAASKSRAKKFVTRVGEAGIYDVFKLDGAKTEVKTANYGGGAQVSFEEFLTGRLILADMLDIILEGIMENIYKEIEKALIASTANMPAANIKSNAGFDEDMMDALVQIADSYGKAVIYCTYEMAARMVPATGWVSDEMRNKKWNMGYLGDYKGHKVVVLEQSFTDETNATKVIDPSYAWIIPAGAEMPVKIAFEGQTHIKDIDNYDWSTEVQVYKKFGVGILASNNICRFEDTSL